MEKSVFQPKPVAISAAAQEECCGKCKFAVPNGDHFACHRLPPTAQTIIGTNAAGQAQPLGSVASWAPVGASEWCGEFQMRKESMQ